MKLRAAREQSGKTQAQVAKEVGMPEATYQRYEYDKREPRVRTAIRIAKVLNSTVEELFGAATPDSTNKPDGATSPFPRSEFPPAAPSVLERTLDTPASTS